MIYDYDHEAELRVFNESGELIDVYVTFNIDFDTEDHYLCGQLVHKKTYTLDLGHVSARSVIKHVMYKPTDADLKEWDSEIKSAINKEIRRQTA